MESIEPAALRELKKSFERDGVLVLENFFSPGELEDVRTSIARMLLAPRKTANADRPAYWKRFETNPIPLGPEAEKDTAFIHLKQNRKMFLLTEALLGKGFQENNLLVMATPKGIGQAWHQDCPPDPTQKNYTVNRLIYPSEVSPSSGSVVFVPGSHQKGAIPPGGNQDSMVGEVRLSPRAGTLVILHSCTYHRVTLNQTDEPRVSINFRVTPKGSVRNPDSVAFFRNGTYDFRKNEEATSIETVETK